jgi:hypothetical protein
MDQLPDLDFAGLFQDIADTIRLDLSRTRRALRHRGLRGGGAEDSFRAEGGRTKQLDVVIYDAAKTPTFYRSESVRVLPVECVYAVIEVKSFLDSGELRTSIVNMESVKSLDKKAIIHPSRFIPVLDKPDNTAFYREQVITGFHLYGNVWEYWPINYFVFAYDSIDLHAIAQAMVDYRAPVWRTIDMVCSLEKGLIANQVRDGKFQATPEPYSTLAVDTHGNTLLNFYGLMMQTVSQATLPVFDFAHYIQHISKSQNRSDEDATR